VGASLASSWSSPFYTVEQSVRDIATSKILFGVSCSRPNVLPSYIVLLGLPRLASLGTTPLLRFARGFASSRDRLELDRSLYNLLSFRRSTFTLIFLKPISQLSS